MNTQVVSEYNEYLILTGGNKAAAASLTLAAALRECQPVALSEPTNRVSSAKPRAATEVGKELDLSKVITRPAMGDVGFDAVNPMGRICLFSKGKTVSTGLIEAGNFGIVESDDSIVCLGDKIDLIPFAVRLMAIDVTDSKKPVTCYDPESREFNRIASAASDYNSHCMYGRSFLVFERTSERFHEFFCGAKSSRTAAREIASYLPLTEADKQHRKMTEVQPRGPAAITLLARANKKGIGRWYFPVVAGTAPPFENLPDSDVIVEMILKFMRVAVPS